LIIHVCHFQNECKGISSKIQYPFICYTDQEIAGRHLSRLTKCSDLKEFGIKLGDAYDIEDALQGYEENMPPPDKAVVPAETLVSTNEVSLKIKSILCAICDSNCPKHNDMIQNSLFSFCVVIYFPNFPSTRRACRILSRMQKT
jgi:hypothetical protein